MHGHKRKAAPTQEQEAASATKALKLRSLQSQCLSNHHQNIYTEEAIQLSAKLLKETPEFYTAWNYRKLAVNDSLSRMNDPTLVDEILDVELKLVENALKGNSKAYAAWDHRKWVLSKGYCSLEEEMKLVNEMQVKDLRNFHAWNYRRFVVERTNTSDQDELQYTTDIIYGDLKDPEDPEKTHGSFSNYSAWHYRRADGYMPEEMISREYEYVRNNFMDEDDQSGWFYHRWLFDQTVKTETPRLTSSWPWDGSSIILSGPECFSGSSSSYRVTTLCSEYGSFPLILYFDQAVSGVSPSTVTIDSELKGNEDLVWEPVDRTSRVSSVWVARIKFDGIGNGNKVKVSLGKSPGIVSSRGCKLSGPYELVFTVHIHDIAGESQEGIVSWTDGFDNWDAKSKNLNSPITLDQLNADTGLEWRKKAIKKEIEECRGLSNDKIGKLILARLLMAEETMISDDDAVKGGVHYKEILQLYNDLMTLDSSHEQYYKDEHSVVLLHKVTSSALSRHLYRYRNMNNIACLRLNNLTLSRIASVEKLLFVQMLDLSHNELHSAEGLEAMQLLCCVNLSHNRIRSFSALDSLRHLKQLRVLDVSHNHIDGKKAVDTTRYLCDSPLSNSSGKIGREVPSKYWNAYLVLSGLMELRQLDIKGNDLISGEEFSSFVRKVVPKLVWLDGHKISS